MITLPYTFIESVVLVGVLMMGLMAVGVVIFVLIYQKKFAQQQLTYQQVLLEASRESQERERERVAKELHDSVGAMLATVKLLVHRLPPDSNRPEIVQDIKDMLAQTIQEVRTISRGLSPLVVRRFGCVGALRDYCGLLDEAGDVRITFTFDKVKKSSNFKAELSLYRIAQELIHNAIQHANPSHIYVSLTMHRATMRLEVRNDGRPFDLRTAQRQGIGLLDIQSRLEALRGRLYQKNITEPGSSLVAEFPITPYHKTT